MEEHIKTEDPSFNADISEEAKEAILKLLEKNPVKRIKNFGELKVLPWFSGVDWTSVLERKGRVMQMPKLDIKQLRRKEYYDVDEDKQID